MAAAPVVSRPSGYAPAVAGNNPSIVHTVAKPALPMTDAASQPGPALAAAKPEMAPSTANPQPPFSHDPNYHSLVGILAYSKIQNAWVLRYASVEDSDRYGGSVTLANAGRMNAFKSGRFVRVEGYLIDPNSQQLRPAFQARSIRPVGP
ncbi:MAG TPA: hypothetical protein VH682_06795 [Gemmataceae bacterium]